MDAVLLSRLQFALTIGFHFIFPPLTIGLAWFIVWIMGKYRSTGDAGYQRLARFWINLFALTFAIGVASGLTMEFQFGTNWANYSRFVGDIFGAPLAAEAVFAFFLESTFLGILLFGWGRVSRGAHFVAALLVAVGSTLSAFWIIVANSWMQTPAGFTLRHGRAELTNFRAAVFNPSTLPRFCHTVDGAVMTAAFFLLGISAWYLLRGRQVESARMTLRASLLVALLASMLQLGLGHLHAIQVAHTQPAKMASFEGVFATRDHAPMLLFGLPDARRGIVHFALSVPSGLSLLIAANPRYMVTGLDAIPRAERPPLLLTFVPFHLMVLLGMFFIGFTALGVWLLWRNALYRARWFLWIACCAVPLPFLANELGWMAAEVGRQPWIVYGVMKTAAAISPTVPAAHILASLILFTVIYAALFIVWVAALRRAILRGVEDPAPVAGTEVVV